MQQVENPNRFYVESNGSYKISDAFREFQLSELSGSEQSKQIRVSGISGDQSDVFNFEISLGDQKVIFNAEAGEMTKFNRRWVWRIIFSRLTSETSRS